MTGSVAAVPDKKIKAYNRAIENAFKSFRFRDDALDALPLAEEVVSLPTIKFRCFEFIHHRTFTWEVLETVRLHLYFCEALYL